MTQVKTINKDKLKDNLNKNKERLLKAYIISAILIMNCSILVFGQNIYGFSLGNSLTIEDIKNKGYSYKTDVDIVDEGIIKDKEIEFIINNNEEVIIKIDYEGKIKDILHSITLNSKQIDPFINNLISTYGTPSFFKSEKGYKGFNIHCKESKKNMQVILYSFPGSHNGVNTGWLTGVRYAPCK
jgi:hypothetical protein